MKLIFIYGAPATGKYTVAKELQKLTGYKLLHNHLTADLASSVFDTGTQEYSDLSSKLRLTVITECIENKIPGLIMTYAYGLETYEGKSDDDFIKKILEINKDGETFFVKLECSKEEQLKRVANASRKKFNKLTDPDMLSNIQSKYAANRTIPFVESVVLDNTVMDPNSAAKTILNSIC